MIVRKLCYAWLVVASVLATNGNARAASIQDASLSAFEMFVLELKSSIEMCKLDAILSSERSIACVNEQRAKFSDKYKVLKPKIKKAPQALMKEFYAEALTALDSTKIQALELKVVYQSRQAANMQKIDKLANKIRIELGQ